LCHPIALSKVSVDFEIDSEANAVHCLTRAECVGRTGVEMEALCATSIALLTIYDMCKASIAACVSRTSDFLKRPAAGLATGLQTDACRHNAERQKGAKKKPARGGSLIAHPKKSGARDIRCLLALRALRHVEGNLLALFEGLESTHGDRGEMGEEIFAAIIRSNEAKTLSVIEPLNCTSCHIATSLKKD
jgi:hypothetical protein